MTLRWCLNGSLTTRWKQILINALLVNKKDEVVINLGEMKIEKLLGMKVDTKLNVNEHLNDMINRKVNALSRVVPYMSLWRYWWTLVILQFSYCLFTWMFHNRIMNNKINWLHERCMRLIYGDKTSSFDEILEQDKSVSIHTRTLQMLATEIFKVYRNMSPSIFSEFSCWRDICYNLRSKSNIAVPNVKSVFHGSESVTCLGPKVWNIVPLELKELTRLNRSHIC